MTFTIRTNQSNIYHLGRKQLAQPFFSKIQEIVDFAVNSGLATISIEIGAGAYPDPIILPDGYGFVFCGPVSGGAMLGPITWKATGGLIPLVPKSYLLLRSCACTAITIVDGHEPASSSLLIGENAAVLGNIVATGQSNVTVLFSGISTASSEIAGNNVSSLIMGNIIAPHSQVGLTNTQVLGRITAKQLWTSGSQFSGSVTITGNVCQMRNTTTTMNGSITFDNPGTFHVDAISYHSLLQFGYTINNGKIVRDDTGTQLADDAIEINICSDLVLSPAQYSTRYIVLSGTLPAGAVRRLTFPIGLWFVNTDSVVFNGSGHTRAKLMIHCGNNSNVIEDNDTYQVSTTPTSVRIK